MPVTRTLRIFGDSITFSTTCSKVGCGAKLWFAQLVKSGKWMPFDREPVALKTEPAIDDPARQVWLVDGDDVHWPRCPGSPQFRRDR